MLPHGDYFTGIVIGLSVGNTKLAMSVTGAARVFIPSGTVPDFKGLRDKGVRAARFSHRSGAGANFAGSASFEDFLPSRASPST